MLNFNESVDRLKPILIEYLTQLREVEGRLQREGEIEPEICAKCARKDIVKAIKFSVEASRSLPSLLGWVKSNGIKDLSSDGEVIAFRSTAKEIEGIEGNIPLLQMGDALFAPKGEVSYEYRFTITRLGKHPFVDLLRNQFSFIRPCPHITDISANNYLALVTRTKPGPSAFMGARNPWESPSEVKTLEVLCKACHDRIDSIGCESSIRSQGFVFVHNCPTRRIIFERILEKNGVKFTVGDQGSQYDERGIAVYLPEMELLALDSSKDLEGTVKKLRPSVILAFGLRQELPHFIQFGTSVILVDDSSGGEPLVVFDSQAPIETSEDRIINSIVSRLDSYSSELRGKEHDKLIGAFNRIGKELGFIPETEMSQKGARVDIVWWDREGKVYVAIEVETSAQWKKDIVTTWETDPKLAVVLAHYKTEKGIEDIVQYNLLQYMPHKLLFISYLQRKAYLIERGQVIKAYDVKP